MPVHQGVAIQISYLDTNDFGIGWTAVTATFLIEGTAAGCCCKMMQRGWHSADYHWGSCALLLAARPSAAKLSQGLGSHDKLVLCFLCGKFWTIFRDTIFLPEFFA